MLCLVRFALWLVFLGGIYSTYQEVKESSLMINTNAYNKYFACLGTLGTFYFISLPVAVIFAEDSLPGPDQQTFIHMAVYTSQLCALFVCLY